MLLGGGALGLGYVFARDADVRLRVASADNTGDVFVGIARQEDIDLYLAGVAHDEVTELNDGLEPVYRRYGGSNEIAPPSAQGFSSASRRASYYRWH